MKILLVAGHGKRFDGPSQQWINDPGAVANGTNERDFNRKYIVPNIAKYLKQAGHSVFLYGGTAMNQDLFGDTAYGEYIGNYSDYGMYWVNKQKYDVVVEFHLDAAGPTATGGHVIIPVGLSADNIDKRIHSVLNNTVGTIRGVTGRDNLLNCNVAKNLGVNYRLVELGFITSKKDMDYLKKNYDLFSKKIAEAIHGKAITTKQKAPVKTTKTVVKPKTVTRPKKIEYKLYKVKKGNTLSQIAQAYKVSVDSLVKLNGIKKNAIFIDQIIRIMPLDDWNKRQAVKKKAPVTKRTALKTKNEMLDWINGSVGEYFDYDGMYNIQCFDYANAYWHQMFKHGFSGMEAANIPMNNQANLKLESTVYRKTASNRPQAGDVLIFDWTPWENKDFGHVAVALSCGENGVKLVEQNYDGNANTPASVRTTNYNNLTHFIRPNYK